VNIVHDEVIFEAEEAAAPRVVQLLRDCLEAGMAKVLIRVTPRMDITTGPTWAQHDQTGG
jgi:DNA polymerase I-like protein with 3'-5' exonuclease and polymerase domains